LTVAVCVACLLAGCSGGRSALALSDEELASPATLNIGDAAPPLDVAEWVKGGPVERYEPGTVYLIDFWMTWCGPCLASMERTSTLQDHYRDRVVVVSGARSRSTYEVRGGD
jgi:thiol-disulfide isomerase/thioredoxin